MNNLAQVMQIFKSGGNPQQLVLNMLQQQAGNTPMGQNLLSLAQNNDGQAIEQIARNLCSQRGLDFNTEFANFRKQLGL